MSAPSLSRHSCGPNAGRQPLRLILRRSSPTPGQRSRAKTDAFMARLEAIDTILEDAEPYDVLMVCAHVLAQVVPLCCEAHEDEFKTEFLQILSDCVDQERDVPDAADAEGDDGAPPQVH